MMFKESIAPNRPSSQEIETMPRLHIAEVIALVLGYTPDQFTELKITPYYRSIDFDNHMAKVIADSDVVNCPKWSEMHEFAHDLNDENLNTTLIDNTHYWLCNNFELMNAYIRQFKIHEITVKDDLLFYAFEDQECEPDFNFYQVFLINEISRLIEEQRNVFSGINGESFMAVVLNHLRHSLKNKELTKKCFDLYVSLKCGLATVAQEHEQEWDGEEWITDNV